MVMVEAKFLKRKLLTPDLAEFQFEANNVKVFIPGQYNALQIAIGTEKPITRAFSIASPPSALPRLEYLVRWVQNGGKRDDGRGEMTTELFELSDDKLKETKFSITDPPKGKLYLEKGDNRNIIMVATGTGLAPFMSQLRTAVEENEDLSKYTLIHGVANCDDLAYNKELSQCHNLTYLHVESRSTCEGYGENGENNYVGELFFRRDSNNTGRINMQEIKAAIKEGRTNNPKIQEILGEKLNRDNYAVMLCGNPVMIENMTELLKAKGFKDGIDILSEKYWSAKKQIPKT